MCARACVCACVCVCVCVCVFFVCVCVCLLHLFLYFVVVLYFLYTSHCKALCAFRKVGFLAMHLPLLLVLLLSVVVPVRVVTVKAVAIFGSENGELTEC